MTNHWSSCRYGGRRSRSQLRRFTGHIRDAATGLTYAQARHYNPVIARFYAPDPVGFASGGPGYFNRYAYTMNDPVNLVDPTGRHCVPGVNSGSSFCLRAARMRALHDDPIISGRTSFALAASWTMTALASIEIWGSPTVTSESTRNYLRQSSAVLEQANTAMLESIRNGGGFFSGSIEENDAAMVRYEQRLVQGMLNGLQATDPDAYEGVVTETNRLLNRPFSRSEGPRYQRALDTARSTLGVDRLDFANEGHRVAIGDALTGQARRRAGIASSCTGTRLC